MTRTVAKGSAVLVFVAVASFLASGCPKASQVMQALVFPASGHAEFENDTLAGPPPSLGGPYGGGSETSVPNRPTPVLPNHIESLSEAQLVAYLKKLVYDMGTYGSERANLPCKHAGSPCAGDSASVYIQAEIGMNRWNRDSIPEFGMIVARVIDYDTDTSLVEARYGFRPRRHAWWVVDRASPKGPLRSRFVERRYGATPAVSIINGASFAFRDCGHTAALTRPARAKWWGCDSTRADTTLPAFRSRPRPSSYFQTIAFHPADAPSMPEPGFPFYAMAEAWVTCGQGCCVADP